MPVALPSHGRWSPARGVRRHRRGPRVPGRRLVPGPGDRCAADRPPRPRAVRPGPGERFVERLGYISGDLDDPATYAALGTRLAERDARGPGRQRAAVLPGDSPQPLPGHDQPPLRVGRGSPGARSGAAALGADHHREAVRPRPGQRRRAECLRAPGLRRAPGLPHRPLPRQGDGPESPGVPLRQLDLRAGLEPAIHDHVQITVAESRGRGAARRVLRGGRASCATCSRTTCCSSWR